MPEMLTVLDVIQRSTAFLEGKKVESARLNAEWLIAAAMGIDRMKLYMQFDRPLREQELSEMRSMVARRGKREPLQYILGTTPFHDIELKVDKRALIPRPETEQLVELAIDTFEAKDGEYRILDLGTGSGAIALAFAQAFQKATVLAVDASEGALSLASENAQRCGFQDRVDFRRSDWFSEIGEEERFDLIASNPPYLTESEVETAEPEVREHEPVSALLAEDEGLADLKQILEGAFGRLNPGGLVWLETGIAHKEALLETCERLGYVEAAGVDDWSGRPRFVRCRRP